MTDVEGAAVTTWPILKELWDARDARYRQRRDELTTDDVALVRANRSSEVFLLPLEDRTAARKALIRWIPPHSAFDGGAYRRVA